MEDKVKLNKGPPPVRLEFTRQREGSTQSDGLVRDTAKTAP